MSANYLTFDIGPQTYALPLESVREVVRLPALLGVVGASDMLAGLMNLRGKHMPVLDGHALVDLPHAYSLSSQIVILDADLEQHNEPLGLLVDQVRDVMAIARGGTTKLSGQAAPYLSAVVTCDEITVTLLDPRRLRALLNQTEETATPISENQGR